MSGNFGPSIPFYKVHGCGNDFVAIDNRELRLPVIHMQEWAKKICQRSFGVGTDGIFFLENASNGDSADIVWHFYNEDGSRAEMCGNASRCAARLAYELGMVPAQFTLGTDAGPVSAHVFEDTGLVEVQLMPPHDLQLNLSLDLKGVTCEAHYVVAGVPHVVLINEDVWSLDVKTLGAEFRYHEQFAPAGTNANFIQVLDRGHMDLRTYERGVEAETYACGTGACASVFIAHALGLTDNKVEVKTTGGERLTITVADQNVYLKGAAVVVFAGQLFLQSVGLEI